jgi:hypothetical protein
MVVESFACPVCAEQIAPGRLSCPQCGTVLAAVARSWRSEPVSPEPAPAIVRPSAPSWLDAAVVPAPSDEAVGETLVSGPDDGWDDAPASAEPVETEPPPMPTPVAALLEAAPERWHLPVPGQEPAPEPIDGVAPGVPEPPTARSLLRPAARANPFLVDGPVPDVLHPVEPPSPPASVAEEAPAWTPAAYVPPPAAAGPVPSVVEDTASEPAPARILPRAWDPAAATVTAPATPPVDLLQRLRQRQRFAMPAIDRARFDEAAGVVVLAGAMGSLVAFLLPWSRVVIGSRGAGTYFDTWGLAGQGHLVVFLAVLGALALAAIPNRIDTWLRTGVVGIALGALLLGLAWPYAFGPLGAGVGIVLLVVAACLLLFGGLLSTLVQRHGGTSPGV